MPRADEAAERIGAAHAASGQPWQALAAGFERDQRHALAGWLRPVVAAYRSDAKGIAMFHAKQRRNKAPWDGGELELLRLGCEMAAPKPLLAVLLGRSHVAVRSKAKNCGFTRRAP